MSHQRGRRDPERLTVGESVDFWRVEEVKRGELLRLRAEMRMPGLAWLEWKLEPATDAGAQGCTRITQRALFSPRGLAGDLYWWSVAPFHGLIFGELLGGLSTAAEGDALLPPEMCVGAAPRSPAMDVDADVREPAVDPPVDATR
jgi:hypothetical protein